LDDLEGQYCNKNCISCSAFSLATAELPFLLLYPVETIAMYVYRVTQNWSFFAEL